MITNMAEIIQEALNTKDFDDCPGSYIRLAELAHFNEKELEMLEFFWDYAYDRSLIRVTPTIIYDYIGYKESDLSLEDFYQILKTQYREPIDYHYSDDNDRYDITDATFKKMCIKANTIKGDETYDYFNKIEWLSNIMRYYEEEKFKLEIKELTEKNKSLENELLERKNNSLEKSSIVNNIATMNINNYYSKQS